MSTEQLSNSTRSHCFFSTILFQISNDTHSQIFFSLSLVLKLFSILIFGEKVHHLFGSYQFGTRNFSSKEKWQLAYSEQTMADLNSKLEMVL
uniref:Uncharacterized protein n=1 Tax=Cannabis sativa TaxID=3483 RepID=A0A803R9I9_CANSA